MRRGVGAKDAATVECRLHRVSSYLTFGSCWFKPARGRAAAPAEGKAWPGDSGPSQAKYKIAGRIMPVEA